MVVVEVNMFPSMELLSSESPDNDGEGGGVVVLPGVSRTDSSILVRVRLMWETCWFINFFSSQALAYNKC